MNEELAKEIIKQLKDLNSKMNENHSQTKQAINELSKDVKEVSNSVQYLVDKTTQHDKDIYLIKNKKI
jgi:ABC-type transporter Mla subunit MlaD